MKKLNWKGVLMGGLVAGLVMNVLDFLINVTWLGPEWQAAAKALNQDPTKLQASAGAGWTIVDFLSGIFVMWLYAAIRPRFGAGPKTALIAGFAFWFILHLFAASYVFMGYAPMDLMVKAGIAELSSSFIPVLIGAWLYKEK